MTSVWPRCHIIDAKMDPERVNRLYQLGARVGLELVDSDVAEVLMTTLKGPLRLARYLPSDMSGKTVVSPNWLEDSAQAQEPRPTEAYLVPLPQSFQSPSLLKAWQERNGFEGNDKSQVAEPSDGHGGGAQPMEMDSPRPASRTSFEDVMIDESALTASTSSSHPTRYACLRKTPLVCPNQALVDQLSVIRHFRDMEGEKRSELSYSHAIAACKAWPRPLEKDQVLQLNGVGKKIEGLILEFLDRGRIQAVDEILVNPRYLTLDRFWKVHDAGSVAVRRWAGQGLGTIQDVLDHVKNLTTAQREGLKYYHDFAQPMSRATVDRLVERLTRGLQKVEPSVEWVVCGGYRRGKPYCNDIDLILTTRKVGAEFKLLSRYMSHLEKEGLLTSVLHFSERHHPPAVQPDSAFIVVKDAENGLERRVDLILSPRGQYGSAILGWTGSKTFERDLRLYAVKERGLKFDSGGIVKDDRLLPEDGRVWEGVALGNDGAWQTTNSAMMQRARWIEMGCFKTLGLAWIEPELRNAD